MNTRPLVLTDMTEREWDQDLFGGKKGLATILGWESQWTFLSKGSRAGFPDRTLARDRVIFVELKRALTGRKSEDRNRQPSPAQVAWLDRLAKAGAETYLWRPTDLEDVVAVLTRRTRPDWTPDSAWIPGLGRADTTTQANLLKENA